MSPRPPLGIERWGTIHVRGTGPYVASCYFRDSSGKRRRIERQGRTKGIARGLLEDALRDRLGDGTGDLSPSSTLATLGALWWAEYIATDAAQQTRNRYAAALADVASNIGDLRLREATVPRLDRYLNAIHQDRGASVAKVQRVVLKHMATYAVRHGALDDDPVSKTRLPANETAPVVAVEHDVVGAAREAILAYDQRTHTSGTLGLYADLLIATGARPSEVLALRWDNVDLDAGTVSITGTVIYDERDRPVRQPFPKSAHGFRRLHLPEFAVSLLLGARTRAVSEFVVAGRGGVMQHRRGIARSWRDALRGTAAEGTTPRGYRKTVATLLARELGPAQAAAQLGHHDESVTKAFYIERLHDGPDARDLLARLVVAVESDAESSG